MDRTKREGGLQKGRGFQYSKLVYGKKVSKKKLDQNSKKFTIKRTLHGTGRTKKRSPSKSPANPTT